MGCEDCLMGMLAIFIISIIIAVIAGIAASASNAAKEEERKKKEKEDAIKRAQFEEEARIQREEQKRFESEKKYYDDAFGKIESRIVSFEEDKDPVFPIGFEELYDKIEKHSKIISNTQNDLTENTNNRIRQAYLNRKNDHIKFLHEVIGDILSQGGYSIRLGYVIKAVHCLKFVDYSESAYVDEALKKVQTLFIGSVQSTLLARFSSYGEPEEGFLDEAFMEKERGRADERMKSLSEMGGHLADGSCRSIIAYLQEGFVPYACRLMWYYAALKPFQVDKFDKATELFNKYTLAEFENYSYCKADALLARIYSKKQLGGENIAAQESEYLDQWLDALFVIRGKEGLYEDDNAEIYNLTSGLAWMELENMELNVLRKLVENNVKLPEELQYRLEFLEGGGRSDLKVYTDVPEDKFNYDLSCVEWKKTDFDFFFRKIKSKKIIPAYSLVMDRWTKTFPLVKGQSISQDVIYQAFEELVEDFDNEITCMKVCGKAVNLSNVENPDATLFRFLSERNRCVSMLFSCEKYGRNLNIEILTLFTPEAGIGIDQLENYCMAIKGNVYAESFKESILQTVDDAIKVKNEIYDSSDLKNKVFE